MSSARRRRGPGFLLLVHARERELGERVERPLRRRYEPRPLGAEGVDRVLEGEPDVRALAVQVLLHLPDDRASLPLIRRQLLLGVHAVVLLVAVAAVAPAAVLGAR